MFSKTSVSQNECFVQRFTAKINAFVVVVTSFLLVRRARCGEGCRPSPHPSGARGLWQQTTT